jgi:hypothetical protein
LHRRLDAAVTRVDAGAFTGASDEMLLGRDRTVIFEPGEPQGTGAGSSPLQFLAIIAPRAGNRAKNE